MTCAADKHVASPCIRNCCLDADNICMGCHRALREICDWSDATDEQRLEILARCAQRQKNRGQTPFSRNQ